MYLDRNKGEILRSAFQYGVTRAFSETERRRLHELEEKGVLQYENFDSFKPTALTKGDPK